MAEHLFVYGTLRRQSPHAMARFLAERARFVNRGRVRGQLYHLGRYPGMVAADSPDDWVVGDVFELVDAPEILAELDRYENGPAPTTLRYERTMAAVTLDDGRETSAWVYWYRGSLGESELILSGDFFEGSSQTKSPQP